jgi:glycosyltransferase involved in cell wall biosynthesis
LARCGGREVNNEAAIWWSERLEHFLYRKADLITATTRGFVQTISGLPDSAPCLLVPNGTNLNLFRPEISGDSKRRELGIEGRFVVGFAGNLGIAQDLDTILEAATELKEAPVTFLFIGAGPEKTRIKQKAKDLRLGNTLFLPQVPVSEILPYLLSVDVFLVTLHRDPLFSSFIPSKLYDYMACEKAVITNVPGEARRIVEESGAGIAVPPADASALADAIRQLVEDPARREAMGKNGRAFVKMHFDRERIANSLVRSLD